VTVSGLSRNNPILKNGFISINLNITVDGIARSERLFFSVIPAEVPRQARDPELVEWAGIQGYQEPLDPGFRRGDGSKGFSGPSEFA
jgi:hypothetical protein